MLLAADRGLHGLLRAVLAGAAPLPSAVLRAALGTAQVRGYSRCAAVIVSALQAQGIRPY